LSNEETMSRWLWVLVCAILGLVMLLCGLLMPAHLRAVDSSVIQRAGSGSRTLLDQAALLCSEQRVGSCQVLMQVAHGQNLPADEKLQLSLRLLISSDPALLVFGAPDPLLQGKVQLPKVEPGKAVANVPITDLLVRQENRTRAIELLQTSRNASVQAILQCRNLTNTVLFPPSRSASGQALDTAVGLCGLLIDEGRIHSSLASALVAQEAQTRRGASSHVLEQALMDLLSLGQRLNWGQLISFVSQVQDTETLRLLANLARQSESNLPVLFAAVELSGKPADVTKYVMDFSQTGLKDLGLAMKSGAGGLKEILGRNQRMHTPPFDSQILVDFCWHQPWIALGLKWVFYLAAGFLLAAAVHFARPAVAALEEPLQVRGFHIARELLFALGFLLVVLLLTEPYLSQETQKVDFPFRIRLPTVGSALASGEKNVHSPLMNQLSLLTLLLFFVLQGLLYIACLFKLAEIRRQKVPPRLKLRLLDNEDHLFDAGLYLGFVGTIISLILVSLGVIKPSLMAAYSSTSFGIIFVSIFKIFHLRPVRRKLVLESESATPDLPLTGPGPTAKLATPA
jgi:hypothetical protein